MPKEKVHPYHSQMRKERIAYGIFICALGCLWLAAEMGWVRTGLPLGPIITIMLGLTMLLPWLNK